MFMQDERHFQDSSDAETRSQNIQTDKSYLQDNMIPLQEHQIIQTEKSYMQDVLPPVQDKQVFTAEDECAICSQKDQMKIIDEKQSTCHEKESPCKEIQPPCHEKELCHVEKSPCQVEKPPCQQAASSCHIHQEVECYHCEYNIPQRCDGIRYPTQYGAVGEAVSRIRHFNPPMKAAFAASLPKPDKNSPQFRKSYICVCAPKCPEVASLLSFEQLACMCEVPPPTPQSVNNLGRSISLPNVTDSCKCSDTNFFSTKSVEGPCASKVVFSSAVGSTVEATAEPTAKAKEDSTPCDPPSMESRKPVCSSPKFIMPSPYTPPMPVMSVNPPMPPREVVQKNPKICPCCKQSVPQYTCTPGGPCKPIFKKISRHKSCTCGYTAVCSDEQPCVCETAYQSFISDTVDETFTCTCGAQPSTNYHSLDSEDDDNTCTCGTNYKSEKTCASKAATKEIMNRVYSEIKMCTCGGTTQGFVIDGKTCTCGVPSKTNYKSIYSDKADDKSCTCGALAQKYFVKEKDKSRTCGGPSKTTQKSIYSDIVDDQCCGAPSKTIEKTIYSDIVDEQSCTCGTSPHRPSVREEDKSCTCGVPSKTKHKSVYSDITDDPSCTCGTSTHKSSTREEDKSCTCGVPSKTNHKSVYSDIADDPSCTCGTSAHKPSVREEDQSCTCGVPSKTKHKSVYSDLADDQSCTCGTSAGKHEDKSRTCGTVSKTKSVLSNKDDSCPCATPTEVILKGVNDTKSGSCKPASKVTMKKVCSDKQKDKLPTCGTASKTKNINKDGSCPCKTVSTVIVKSFTDMKSCTCGPSAKVIYNSVHYEKTSCSSRQPSIANKSACSGQKRKLSICSSKSGVSDIFKNCVETSFKEEKSTSIYESAENSSTKCCSKKKSTSDVVTSLHPECISFCICKENGKRQQSPSIKKKSSCNANVRSSTTKKRKQSSSAYNPRKSKTRKSMQGSTRTSSRSRSVMAEVTCLCTSTDRAILGATNRTGPPFGRVLRSGLSITPVNPCLLSLTDERDPRASVLWKDDNFCDCLSVSTDSEVDLGLRSNKSTRSVGGTQQQKSTKTFVEQMLSCLPKPAIISCKNEAKIVDEKPKDEPNERVKVKQMLGRLKAPAPQIIGSCVCESEVTDERSCDCPPVDETDDGCQCEPQVGCECEQEDCLKVESQGGCECEQEDSLKTEPQGCECPTEETDLGCTCNTSVSRSGGKSCLVESNKTGGSCHCASLRSVAKDIFKSCINEPISSRSIPCKATVSQTATRRSVAINEPKKTISAVSCRSCSTCPMDRKIYSLRIDESDNTQDCTCKSPEVCHRQPPFVCKSETLLVCKREPEDGCTCNLPVKCNSEPQLDCDCKPEPECDCDCTCDSQADLKTQPKKVSTNKNSCNCAKDRIVNMLDLISDKCDTKTDRSVVFQQIIKELTDMLRDAEKSEECPCSSVKDCMEAVKSGRSLAKEAKARKEASNQKLTKGYLDRMEKCLNDCFPTKKPGQGFEIVAFEFDPKLLEERAAAEAAAKAAAEAACEAEAAALAAAEAKAGCECGEAEPAPPAKFQCACGVPPIESAVFQDCECLEEPDSKAGFPCGQEPDSRANNQVCPACAELADSQVCLPCVEGCEKDFQDVCGPLTDRERQLCDYLICRMCQICQGQADQDECPGTSNNTDAEKEAHKSCLCCHCCAMECDNQCKTVKKVLDPIECDPVREMQCFVDSMISDLQAVDHVVNKNKLYPKTKPSKCMGSAPGDSFPVVITEVSSLGCRALYLRWELLDCAGVGGYEIYVDGHLTNRFYNYRHEATVISNVDVTQPHQIILRTQALGQEFPDENDSGCSKAMVNAHPELLVGATEPWKPSVYMYEP